MSDILSLVKSGWYFCSKIILVETKDGNSKIINIFNEALLKIEKGVAVILEVVIVFT